MRTLISFLLIVIAVTEFTYAQQNNSFWNQHVFGTGITESPAQLSIDIYPFLFLSNGGGGSIGVETGHFQFGITGFSVKPPEFIVNSFFNDSDNITIPRNEAIEAVIKYYLRPDRKWIYFGLIGGPERFEIKDPSTGNKEILYKSYAVPLMGIRWFPFKEHFYADASFGYSFNLSGTETRSLGNATYSPTSGSTIYFLQLGVQFKISNE